MGQRFQTYVSYGNGENLFAQHLQWCWGDFAVIRAQQLTSFLKEQIDYEYDYFRLNNLDCYNDFGKSTRKDYQILKCLNEINLINKSIVNGIDLMKEQLELNEYYYEKGAIKEMPKTIKINYKNQDNNDGALIIKAEKGSLKYAFVSNEDLYSDNEEVTPITARQYMKEYSKDIHIEKDKLKEILEELDNIELLTYPEIKEIFDKEYDKDLNIIS